MSVFFSLRDTAAIVRDEMVRGDASLFVDALLMLTSPSWLLLLSRKANRYC